MELTEKQRKVVEHEYGNLIVTASAGSGKTGVMTKRFCRLVEKGLANVDNILCVTFTKSATAELKKRLADGLREALPDVITAENKAFADRLQEQIALIPTSFIYTIDAFCNFLVKKYFYAVDVDPQYSIIEEAKEASIKQNAVDELFERLYETADEDMLLLLKSFSKSRNDKNLKEFVLNMQNVLSGEIDKKAYLDKAEFMYSTEGTNYIVKTLIDELAEKCKALYPDIDKFILDCKEAGVTKYKDIFETLKTALENFEKTRTIEDFSVVDNVNLSMPKIGNLADAPSVVSARLKDRFAELKGKIKGYLAGLGEVLNNDTYVNSDNAGKLFKSLRKVIELFDEEYQKAKREISVLDYADLEYYAYMVLQNKEILEELKADFKYIFVDEYQDTNAMQDAIFAKLQDNNLFVVGDMKQSIYAFRGCDCTLFNDRIKGVKEGDTLLQLDKNFRSSKAVIEAVNNIFSTVMTKESMDLPYADNPMEYGEKSNNEGEVFIVQHINDEKVEKPKPTGVYSIEKHLEILNGERNKQEEVTIRRIIENVLKQTYIDKNGEEKTYSFGDIAVIARTNNGPLERIAKELVEAGIPVVANSKRSVGEYPEIKMLLSILQCVNYGGKEDFSLAATLKSPVGNFSDEELLRIRNAFPKKDKKGGEVTYAEAVIKYRDKMADKISLRLKNFFEYIDKLRLLANFKNVGEILKRVVLDSDIEVYLLKSSLGDIKQKRVNRFINELESKFNISVAEFVRNEDAILDKMTVSFAEGDNSVKLMTIHHSKGLQYPVVIQCEMDRNFFKKNNGEEIANSKKYGIGLRSYDIESRKKTKTVQYFYVNKMKNIDTLQEEFRMFYVAATRAEHKLYIVTTSNVAENINSDNVLSANMCSDFLAKDQCKFMTSGDLEEEVIEKQDVRPAILATEPTKEQLDKIGKYINFVYPYESDTKLSLKTTVTEATKRIIDDLEFIPIVNSGDVDTGNAYHRFLELSKFDKLAVDAELKEFLESGKISQSEFDLLDADKLKQILSCEIFDSLKGYKLYREQPFMCLVPASLLGEVGESEVLIQGVIDLLAINGDDAIIVDYKYSGLSNDDLLSKYRKQLELYGYAVEKVLKKNLKGMYLFNINTVSLIKVV